MQLQTIVLELLRKSFSPLSAKRWAPTCLLPQGDGRHVGAVSGFEDYILLIEKERRKLSEPRHDESRRSGPVLSATE